MERLSTAGNSPLRTIHLKVRLGADLSERVNGDRRNPKADEAARHQKSELPAQAKGTTLASQET